MVAIVNVLTVFFATQNKGKQREISELMADVPDTKVVFPDSFPELAVFDPEETGTTLHQNAELKARAFADKAKLTTIAEDSGIEVDALGGKPGVYSKRFFPGTDADRNQELLRLLLGVTNRAAQFRSVFCLFNPKNQQPIFFEGVVRGRIAVEASLGDGFGYDPIFIPEGYTQPFAQLGQAVKNSLSHRARAMAEVKKYLLTQ